MALLPPKTAAPKEPKPVDLTCDVDPSSGVPLPECDCVGACQGHDLTPCDANSLTLSNDAASIASTVDLGEPDVFALVDPADPSGIPATTSAPVTESPPASRPFFTTAKPGRRDGRKELPTLQGDGALGDSDAEGINLGAITHSSDFLQTATGLALTAVISALDEGEIPPSKIDALRDALPMETTAGGRGKLSIVTEIETQIKVIRGLRDKVLTPSGNLRGNHDLKDAKYVIQTADTALKTLMSHQKELTNIENIQKLEQAISMAIENMDPEVQKQFLAGVEAARRQLG